MIGTFTLVIETSTPRASLASIEPGGHCELREFTSDRSHNAVLFSPLKELLDARDGGEIGLVLVGSGPGSYSGTRVGIAAAQGVAIVCSCQAVAVPSILAVKSAQDGAPCLAIGDARRGSFWTAKMENSRLLADPELTDARGLEVLVSSAVADGLSIFSFEEPGRFPVASELQAQISLEFPNAERLWLAWQATPPDIQEKWRTQSPQPMYLKPPHITPAKRDRR